MSLFFLVLGATGKILEVGGNHPLAKTGVKDELCVFMT